MQSDDVGCWGYMVQRPFLVRHKAPFWWLKRAHGALADGWLQALPAAESVAKPHGTTLVKNCVGWKYGGRMSSGTPRKEPCLSLNIGAISSFPDKLRWS